MQDADQRRSPQGRVWLLAICAHLRRFYLCKSVLKKLLASHLAINTMPRGSSIYKVLCLIPCLVVCGGVYCRTLHAEAVGSPSSILKKGRWMMGLGAGALLDRALEGGAKATSYQLGHSRGYGLTDRLSVYGKIGVAYVEVDDSSIKRSNDLSTLNRFDAGLFWSAQVKGRIWENAKKDLEWDGSVQFMQIRERHKDDNEGTWNDWRFATSVAKAFGRVKPYIGVLYNLIDFDYKVYQDKSIIKQGTYRADRRVGGFLGTDVYFGEYEDVILNVEISYVNGAEMNMAIQYTF